METIVIVLIIFFVIVLLAGLGTGLYFLLRKKPDGSSSGKSNPSNPSNPVGIKSPCDILFNNAISQKSFNDAATVVANGIFSLPKDSNNNLTGCTPGVPSQLLTYLKGYNTDCSSLVEKLVSGPNNCNIGYANAINRFPTYSGTCSTGAQEFINIWASGKCK